MATPIDHELIRHELDRVLSSAGFARSERLSRFLRFVVERHLEGRDGELKESVVGVEVFGREPGFDPKADGIVRTEAIRLRARLDRYYESDGADARLIIQLPKGGYRPVIRQRPVPPRTCQPGHARRRIRTAAAVLLLATGSGAIWLGQHRPGSVAVAVLPFENLSPGMAPASVADGLTDEIISSLALIEGFTVPPRTSSFALPRSGVTAAHTVSRLGADYVVEGSVFQAHDRVRVHAALVRVRDERRVWSGRFDREATDIFSVHDAVARSIVDALRLRIGPGRRRYEENLDAYSLYLRGRQLMASFPAQNRALADSAIDYYDQAIAQDASYALAFAGKADVLLAVERNIGAAPKLGADLLRQAKAAAARALELDPMLSEAHSAIGGIQAREYAWREAEGSLRHAIHLDPDNAAAHLELGFQVLLMQGRVEEGLDHVRRAVYLEPLSPLVNTEYGRALFWARRYDAAIDQLRVAIALEPSRAKGYGMLARVLSARGRTPDAVTIFDEAVRRGALVSGLANGELACVMARAGRAREVAPMLQRQLTNPLGNVAGRGHACLRDPEQALDRFERALAVREPNLAEILQAPDMDWTRVIPRFAMLRQRLNLP